MPRTKLMIVGHGRHGKDTVCEILARDWGYSWTTSSKIASGVVWERAAKWRNSGMSAEMKEEACRIVDTCLTIEDCFEDRHHSHRTRQFWYEAIAEYSREDPTSLTRDIFKQCDIYAGIRNPRELHAAQRAQDLNFLTVWVDRSQVLPPEPSTSMGIEPWMADKIVDNNGTLEDLEKRVAALVSYIRVDERMKDAGF